MTTRRVLIIDDEERIREVLRTCFVKLAKWDVIVADCGSAGIAKAEAEQPDAILLDVSMPEMDGRATLQKLKDNSSTRAIPVIFLTAKVQPTDKAEYAQLGVAGLITKPFNPVTISQQVAEILHWS